MASRMMHLAIINELIKKYRFKDTARLKFGAVLPDACAKGGSTAESHFKIGVCGNNKRTYDFTRYKTLFFDLMETDDLYLGYYLHLVQDTLFRHFVYDEYHWDPTVPGNVDRLHRDYVLMNSYVIRKYGLRDDVKLPEHFEEEPISSVYPFDPEGFLEEMKGDFEIVVREEESPFFFTWQMADEYIQSAVSFCLEELTALERGEAGMDEYKFAWMNTPRVLPEKDNMCTKIQR